MTHYIIQVGNFFGSFNSMFFIWSWIWKKLILWCLEWSFNSSSAPATGFYFCNCIWSKCSNIWQALPVFLLASFLSVLHYFTIWPIWHHHQTVLSSSPSQITSDAGIHRGTKPDFFSSSKKIHKRLPPSCFLSFLESSTVSWLSHDLLLRMSLTLAKESGISAFCRGPP